MADRYRVYTRHGTIDDTIDIPLNINYNQLFVGFTYYADASFTAEAIPTSGTMTVTGKPNGTGGFALLDNGVVDCTDVSATASTNVPLSALGISPAVIVGASHYRVTVTAKES